MTYFYRDHDDLSERHEADRRMIQELADYAETEG